MHCTGQDLPERDNNMFLNFYKNKQSFWFTNHSDLLFLQNRM